MSQLSSVEIKLGAQPPACVLDAELALSPLGLLLALRLAQEWRVWLARSLWPMIDSCRLYDARPHLVRGPEDCGGEAVTPVVTALGDWHQAWLGARINGRFHWIGDHRHESDLPQDADDLLPQRFEALAAALSLDNDDDAANSDWSWRRTCGLEALALAAALSARPTVILTDLKAGATRPAVVGLWEERSGRPAPQLALNGHAPLALPASLRLGLPPLLAGELTLAAVHVAAPRALVIPWGLGGEEMWGAADPGFPDYGPAPDPWDGASLAWHVLS
jgi:hypothetical protein